MNIPKYTHCNKCDEHGFIINNGIATRCDCWTAYKSRVQFLQKLHESNLITDITPQEKIDKFLDYDICSYKGDDANKNIKKVKMFVSEFDTKFKTINLYIYGDNGTQKSTVVKWICKKLLKSGKSVYYIIGKDLIDIIMDSERNEESKFKVTQMLQSDLLVIEEFEKSKLSLFSSNYKQSELIPFLKTRMESICKSTIFISNSEISDLYELSETIGDLVDRETMNCKLHFTDRYYANVKVDTSNLWDD